MKITTEYRHSRLRVWLSGELDHHSAPEVMKTVCREIEECLPSATVVDMSGLSFMDSSGIAVLLKLYKRMRSIEGRLTLINVPPQTARIISMSGIDRLFTKEEVRIS